MGYRIEVKRGIGPDVFEIFDDDGWIATFEDQRLAETVLSWLESQPVGPTVRCQKCLIAVCINHRGEYSAIAEPHYHTKEELAEYAENTIAVAEDVIHIIEASVPLPVRYEPAVVEGRVVEGEKGFTPQEFMDAMNNAPHAFHDAVQAACAFKRGGMEAVEELQKSQEQQSP